MYSFSLNDETKQRYQGESYHLGFVPYILLAMRYCSTQRSGLYILAPVGGAKSTLFSAQQRSRYGCNSENGRFKNGL